MNIDYYNNIDGSLTGVILIQNGETENIHLVLLTQILLSIIFGGFTLLCIMRR
jgi:hypothetical protein